uniref:Uncharacterized protein n=1 Tax=Rhizophagus irregularis (strain DAOM 181602 / DAOM 197198 / MUCL 43194) TaxID=747089 RepID=U9UL88_RHIID
MYWQIFKDGSAVTVFNFLRMCLIIDFLSVNFTISLDIMVSYSFGRGFGFRQPVPIFEFLKHLKIFYHVFIFYIFVSEWNIEFDIWNLKTYVSPSNFILMGEDAELNL